MARVWVVGSLNVDRGWRVARHPAVGETVLGEALAPLPGGKGLNQAVAAARMGAVVGLVGCVGGDEDGRWLQAVAADEGIDVSSVSTAAGAPTGSALIVIDAHGANTVTVAPGANGSLVVDGLLGIEPGDVVVAQFEVPVPAIADAFAEARTVGATTVLNPSPLDAAGTGIDLLGLADVVVVNQPEAAALAGAGEEATSPDEAQRQAGAIALAGQIVVVTLGAGGAVAVDPLGPVAAAAEVVDVVDTTGAGDCFLGVLAASLAADQALDAALRRANRAAARSTTKLGTVPAMPTAAEVDGSGEVSASS